MRFILILIAGVLSAAIVGGANAALQILINWNLTNFMVIILPAGAAVLGWAGALGVGAATPAKGKATQEAFATMLLGPLCGAMTILLFYFALYQHLIYPQILHAPQLSFGTFLNEYFSNITIDGNGSAFGKWLAYSDFVGAAIGGLAGAIWLSSTRREEAKQA